MLRLQGHSGKVEEGASLGRQAAGRGLRWSQWLIAPASADY